MSENQNAALYFVDRHLAEGRANKPVFREAAGEKRQFTYGALAEQSSRFAGALQRAGMRRDERVLLLMLDVIELPVAFWGALKAGVVPIPLNTLLATSVYDEIFHDSRASCLVVSAELYDTVKEALPLNPFIRDVVVVGGDAPDGTRSYADFMDGAEPGEVALASEDETAFWLYSSGSTGRPKGVKHVHGALKATADTYGTQVLKIREDDTVFSAAKIFFAYGLGNAMTFPMSAGATTVLYNGRPTPDTVSSILAQEQPTVFCGVPTLYAALLHYWETDGKCPDAPLRTSISAGEALPAEIGRKWKELCGTDIMDGVGSTEMLHIFLSNKPGDIEYGTSGTPVPGYDVRLVDESGDEVGPGEVGELLVRGASAADGYWNQRGKSRATFEGEWTRTGDKYERNEAGRFIYCGRTDDMFKVSGIWVSPFEVEQALVSHPNVLEAAVVPWRDAEDLEKPKAFVVLKSGADDGTLDALKEFVKERIGKWKYPRWVEVVEELPKTPTGKIQRFKLRQGA
ncbi:benzoate-CoA ligase family protein [Marimonas lutisalis]|uniref:benzoate-CoA ligase family protein n=1 Tax=Marimonas lutisalis TaxID=2545756 RepID=UPI0010F4F4C4|nr:benzoate-CoA ligase family protein [Marimonas lutisalis]